MNYADLYLAISYAWALMVVVRYRKQLIESPSWFNVACVALAPVTLPAWVLIITFNMYKANK